MSVCIAVCYLAIPTERLIGPSGPRRDDALILVTDNRAAFGDFSGAFRFGDTPATPPVLPDTSGPLSRALFESDTLPAPELPASSQRPPVQEMGRRPRVPREGT